MPAPKLQRWIDLLAALLRRHYPVTFEQLCAEVPAYAAAYATAKTKAALRRMFERDKDELRDFGIPIRTVKDVAGEVMGYQLPAKEFYLPYLSVVLDGRATRPRRVDRDGYRALRQLSFEPDELAAVARAAQRVEQLGDPGLAVHARSAIRKLAVDLPMDAVRGTDDDRVVAPRARPAPGVLEALGEALERRKRASFTYYAIGGDTTSRRTVEPWGLFFLGQHWYLAAVEASADSGAVVKNWRLSRIADVEVNATKAGTPDYEIPAGFRLRVHARSRQAWELGDGDAMDAVVDFVATTGAAEAAARLGEPMRESPRLRRFRVRRPDAFARWLLALGGAARVVTPPRLAAEVERQVTATLALYREGA